MIISIGAVCFGIVIGYVTYRSLARSGPTSSVSDIAAVVGAVGGAAITSIFDPVNSDAFGYYAIGLLAGMILYVPIVARFGSRVTKESNNTVFLGSDSEPPQ
jgi:hypothetical protein